MADTDFSALGTTGTIAGTDSMVIVRGGVPYRFTGTLPTINSGGGAVFTAGMAVAGSPNDLTDTFQIEIREGTQNPAYRLRIGYWIPAGGWRGIVDAIQNSIAGGLDIQPSGGETVFGGSVHASPDNTLTMGSASNRWSVVYAGTGSINTSDEREKREIGAIPDEWLDAWSDVEWCRFKFEGGARWHVGLIAQRVHAAFAARGLDAFEIGLCCYDAWEEERAPIIGKNGKATKRTRVVQAAGDRWGLRYDECFAVEAALQRRELARLGAAIESLRNGAPIVDVQHG